MKKHIIFTLSVLTCISMGFAQQHVSSKTSTSTTQAQSQVKVSQPVTVQPAAVSSGSNHTSNKPSGTVSTSVPQIANTHYTYARGSKMDMQDWIGQIHMNHEKVVSERVLLAPIQPQPTHPVVLQVAKERTDSSCVKLPLKQGINSQNIKDDSHLIGQYGVFIKEFKDRSECLILLRELEGRYGELGIIYEDLLRSDGKFSLILGRFLKYDDAYSLYIRLRMEFPTSYIIRFL